MKTFAILMTAIAWLGVFVRFPTWLRIIMLLVMTIVGFLLLVFGGFAWWWDSHMRPSASVAALPICGALILLAQLVNALRAGSLGDVFTSVSDDLE